MPTLYELNTITLSEAKLLLEAFTNWMDTGGHMWTDDGKAHNPKYQTIIEKLEATVKRLGG